MHRAVVAAPLRAPLGLGRARHETRRASRDEAAPHSPSLTRCSHPPPTSPTLPAAAAQARDACRGRDNGAAHRVRALGAPPPRLRGRRRVRAVLAARVAPREWRRGGRAVVWVVGWVWGAAEVRGRSRRLRKGLRGAAGVRGRVHCSAGARRFWLTVLAQGPPRHSRQPWRAHHTYCSSRPRPPALLPAPRLNPLRRLCWRSSASTSARASSSRARAAPPRPRRSAR